MSFQNMPIRDMNSMSPFRAFAVGSLYLWFAFLFTTNVGAQDPMDLPRLMDQAPKFIEVKPQVVFSQRLVPVWMEALESSNVNIQRKAAESLAIAKRRGVGKLDQANDTLLKLLQNSKIQRQVRVAVAKAAVAMELKSAEPAFVDFMKNVVDDELQSIIQPALAKWKSETARQHWLGIMKTASDPKNSVPASQRKFAVSGLTQLNETSIIPSLTETVTNASAAFRYRNECSKALGELTNKGQETMAKELSESKVIANRILAAQVLKRHQSGEGIALQLNLAKDMEPAVCVIAWSQLLESEKARQLDRIADFGIKNKGYKVRQLAIRLVERWKSEDGVKKIASLLPDLHPEVRILARNSLLDLSKVEQLRVTVINEAMAKLDSNWQGIQQALLILTELDHKPAAMKMLELLDHERAEVHVTTGWSLERLSVKETLDPIFKTVESQIESNEYKQFSDSECERTTHLIQLLGKNKVTALENKIIPKLIPKDMLILHLPIRPAAFWSLGQIYDGKELPKKWVDSLSQRLLDDDPMNPESQYVKSMCAYTFAMCGTESMIPNIEKYAEARSPNSRFGFFCNWSLNKLDGREMPVIEVFKRQDTDWFLVPIE